MERLCDEIIQIILNEIDDPTSFSLTSKRIYTFTQVPYVRASYFLSRYGKIQALYWALGRGRLMNEKVIDILLSSGAHLSRYLVQCAMHHYYRAAQVPFIKTPWVRSMHLGIFTYFQGVAVKLYGNIPLGKGDDDGSVMEAVIKEKRFPAESRMVKWETLKEILEKYKFIPFCHKDAMMANFPLVLAIEPGLLPFAAANGFHMDHKYRNFVFRKMFEKPSIPFEGRADEIVRNVRELSRLDAQMFLTRTVAAEICMEVKTNEPAYNALRRLDKENLLNFDLADVVKQLIKTFSATRSISWPHTFSILQQLYADFPSEDSTVRLVLLIQVFQSEATIGINTGSDIPHKDYVVNCQQKIENIGLGPIKRQDLVDILCSRFAPERFRGILEFGRVAMFMLKPEIEALVKDVAFKCLEIGCKGKMLSRLVDLYPFLDDAIRVRILTNYRLDLDTLPLSSDTAACIVYEAPLCRDFVAPRSLLIERLAELRNQQGLGEDNSGLAPKAASDAVNNDELGPIGQDSLTVMIRNDESGPTRNSRRRFYDAYTTYSELAGKLPYPNDNLTVGRWVRDHYGARAAVTAVVMIHAIINLTPMVLQPFIYMEPPNMDHRIPLTLKHFKMLARLGRGPPLALIDEIDSGTEFYFSEEDYLSPDDLSGAPKKTRKRKRLRHSPIPIKMVSAYTVKTEQSPGPTVLASPVAGPSSISAPLPSSSPRQPQRRSRRSAAAAINYVIPDSDDEMIMEDGDEVIHVELRKVIKTRKVESNLQKWIKHLTILLHEEQKKLREKKKLLRAAAPQGTKVKMPKNEFVKGLSNALPRLRKADREKRHLLYGDDVPDEDYSSGEEDEYRERRPMKRRRTASA